MLASPRLHVVWASVSVCAVSGDPVQVAWTAGDCPQPLTGFGDSGQWCARCASSGPTVHSSLVVSTRFTDWDTWPYRGLRLCPACAWAYSTPELRTGAHVVVSGPQPALVATTATDLAAGVLTGPLDTSTAVTVAISGRKHVLPAATWGHVRTDATSLQWDALAARRLTELRWLCTLPSMSPTVVSSPTIPYPVLRDQDPDLWPVILDRWDGLTPWRANSLWWPAALRLAAAPAPVAAR